MFDCFFDNSKKNIKLNIDKSDEILRIIYENIAKFEAKRVKIANERYVSILKKREDHHLRARAEFSRVFILTVAVLGIVVLMNRLLNTRLQTIDIYSKKFSWTYLLVLVTPFLYLLKRSNSSISAFGITSKRWKQSTLEGVTITVAGMVLMSFGGLTFSIIKEIPITNLIVFNVYNPKLLLYLPHTFLQEFMIRGVIQTSLQKFFKDEKGHSSIGVSSLIFGTLHFHYGILAFIVTFLSSIVFGYIYMRHKNIIGVSIIHFTLGTMAISLGWLK